MVSRCDASLMLLVTPALYLLWQIKLLAARKNMILAFSKHLPPAKNTIKAFWTETHGKWIISLILFPTLKFATPVPPTNPFGKTLKTNREENGCPQDKGFKLAWDRESIGMSSLSISAFCLHCICISGCREFHSKPHWQVYNHLLIMFSDGNKNRREDNCDISLSPDGFEVPAYFVCQTQSWVMLLSDSLLPLETLMHCVMCTSKKILTTCPGDADHKGYD